MLGVTSGTLTVAVARGAAVTRPHAARPSALWENEGCPRVLPAELGMRLGHAQGSGVCGPLRGWKPTSTKGWASLPRGGKAHANEHPARPGGQACPASLLGPAGQLAQTRATPCTAAPVPGAEFSPGPARWGAPRNWPQHFLVPTPRQHPELRPSATSLISQTCTSQQPCSVKAALFSF